MEVREHARVSHFLPPGIKLKGQAGQQAPLYPLGHTAGPKVFFKKSFLFDSCLCVLCSTRLGVACAYAHGG